MSKAHLLHLLHPRGLAVAVMCYELLMDLLIVAWCAAWYVRGVSYCRNRGLRWYPAKGPYLPCVSMAGRGGGAFDRIPSTWTLNDIAELSFQKIKLICILLFFQSCDRSFFYHIDADVVLTSYKRYDHWDTDLFSLLLLLLTGKSPANELVIC